MAHRKKIVGIGAGGHGRVVADLIDEMGRFSLVGFTDADPLRVKGAPAPVLGDDRRLPGLLKAGVGYAFLGVGAVGADGLRKRARLYHQIVALGFDLPPLVHPKTFVSSRATLGKGTVVMAGASVCAGARLGDNVVVYSGAVVEHDVVIGNHSHLSPGALIAGGVAMGEGVFVGIGAVVIQGVSIGSWTTVGAGAVVLSDIPAVRTVAGVPARIIKGGKA